MHCAQNHCILISLYTLFSISMSISSSYYFYSSSSSSFIMIKIALIMATMMMIMGVAMKGEEQVAVLWTLVSAGGNNSLDHQFLPIHHKNYILLQSNADQCTSPSSYFFIALGLAQAISPKAGKILLQNCFLKPLMYIWSNILFSNLIFEYKPLMFIWSNIPFLNLIFEFN